MKIKTKIITTMFLIAFGGPNSLSAQSIFDMCVSHIDRGELEAARQLAQKMKSFTGISQSNYSKAEICMNLIGLKPPEPLREVVESEKDLKGQLVKQLACVDAKMLQVEGYIDAIKQRLDEENKVLIVSDTYIACSELYKSDKSEAMLNSSCINAFHKLGHPNLADTESNERDAYLSQLDDLTELRNSLVDKTQKALVDLFKSDAPNHSGASTEVVVATQNRSCSEFGYEGLSID